MEGEAKTCAICLDRIVARGMSKLESCSHEYCLTCIREWAKSNNSCPLCKRKFHKIIQHSNKRVFAVSTPNKPSPAPVADSFISLDSTAFATDSEDSDYVGGNSSDSDDDEDSFDEDDEMELEESVINLISSDEEEEDEVLEILD